MQTQKMADKDATTFDISVVNKLAKYSMFPAYPTSFIVAADTTIEVINGPNPLVFLLPHPFPS